MDIFVSLIFWDAKKEGGGGGGGKAAFFSLKMKLF